MTNRKLHTCFRLVPKSTTVEDLEEPLCTLFKTCLCGYSRGFPGEGSSNDSEVIENVDFQGFQTLRFRHLRKWGQRYYIPVVLFSHLSLFHWPRNTWPWMTSNGHFTLNWQYYERPVDKLLFVFFILTVETVYTRSQRRCVKVDRDPQNIWDPRKDCRSFVDATSSEP